MKGMTSDKYKKKRAAQEADDDRNEQDVYTLVMRVKRIEMLLVFLSTGYTRL